MEKRLAVFVSGKGTLLDAMNDDNLPISLVLADRECRGLHIAQEAGIPVELVGRRSFGSGTNFDRERYTREVGVVLANFAIDFVAMAGFMTVLDRTIFEDYGYEGRILNTHPALLPSFKGDHAVRDALAYGVKVTGCTIHVATEKLDDGRIIAQEAVLVLPGDTEEILHERIKAVERILYPRTIREFAETIV